MAISRAKKESQVEEISQLLSNAKLTVGARYPGTTVKSLQQLRKQAAEQGTTIKVVKNRLFTRALQANEVLKTSDTGLVTGPLLYAFNDQDEVAPAQIIAEFAKTEPQVELVVGFTSDGRVLGQEDLQILADLPSKDQLRAQLVGTIGAPLSGLANVLAGNVRGMLNVLKARAESLS